MTKPGTDGQAPSLSAVPCDLATPQLLLSSAQTGWDGLVAQVFREPREMESWRIAATPAIFLELFTGGAVHLDRRQACASWKGADKHHGDLFLNWGAASSYEVRWWSLSALPTQTLHLRLTRELVAGVAEHVFGVELGRLELVGRTCFRDPLLSQVAFALWRELEQPVPAGKLYAQTAAQLLAVHLVQHYAASRPPLNAAPPSPSGLNERQLQQVLEFIRTHLGEDLSLDTLAQQVGFSPYHFARLFRRALGASVHEVVLRQRLEHARWLLQETEMPLAQVAVACGFADQSHLTRVFRQQVGRTPRAYRRESAIGADF